MYIYTQSRLIRLAEDWNVCQLDGYFKITYFYGVRDNGIFNYLLWTKCIKLKPRPVNRTYCVLYIFGMLTEFDWMGIQFYGVFHTINLIYISDLEFLFVFSSHWGWKCHLLSLSFQLNIVDFAIHTNLYTKHTVFIH